jgi:hypothetical protein
MKKEYQGKNIDQWACEFGITPTSISIRMKARNLTLEEDIIMRKNNITFHQKSGLTDFARGIGLNPSTVMARKSKKKWSNAKTMEYYKERIIFNDKFN